MNINNQECSIGLGSQIGKETHLGRNLAFSWRRKWQPTPVLLPGESHGWRSLMGYSPWGSKESDTTERLALPLAFTVKNSSTVSSFLSQETVVIRFAEEHIHLLNLWFWKARMRLMLDGKEWEVLSLKNPGERVETVISNSCSNDRNGNSCVAAGSFAAWNWHLQHIWHVDWGLPTTDL